MKPRFIVAQMGARMHYAVPEILQRNEALSHLFTDFYYKESAFYRCVDPLLSGFGSYIRLKGRRADVPDSSVTYFPLFGILTPVRTNRIRSSELLFAHFNSANMEFGRKVIRSLDRSRFNFDHIYTFTGAGLELMKEYKGRVNLVHEQIILPHRKMREIMEAEQEKFPDWGAGEAFGSHYKEYEEREIEELKLADVILCGSDFVREGISGIDPELSKKVRVVPYGVSYGNNSTLTSVTFDGQRKLRVFTAGKLGLRKGYQYLLEAAKALHPRVEFRIAGNTAEVPPPKLKELEKYAELLGIVDSGSMAVLYDWADVFLLPTLCEGSATVIYEALQFGLPVVTTPNAGSIIADGMEGLIIRPGDSRGIIDALKYMFDDPDRLAFFTLNAGVKAKDASAEAYERNLLNALF